MADTIDDGTYVMLNLANTALALDCAGATNYDGTNVWLYTRNDSDAQLVRVWTRSDGTRQLCFAASGKCVDVKGGAFAVGTNVQQYTANDSAAQQWEVVAVDGTTGTVGDTSYQAYKVWCSATYSATTKYLLEYQGTGTPASGGNLCISNDEGTSQDQMWLFVPMSPVPDGTYTMRSVLDTSLVADVSGSSHAAGARVIISGWHVGTGTDNGNNQVIEVVTDPETGQSTLEFVHSGQLMEGYGTSTATNRDRVTQCGDYGGTDQRWVISPYGTTRLNGTIVPTYEVRNVAATGTPLCLDVTGGGKTTGTYLELFTQNHSDAQRWVFDPSCETVASMSAPSCDGIAAASSTSPADTVRATADDAPAEWHVAVSGRSSAWQMRYRFRSRTASTGAWSSWTSWRSPGDGSEANGGWGCLNRATQTTFADGRAWSPSLSMDALTPTTDQVQCEYQARAFQLGSDGMSRVSQAVSSTCTLVYVPTATLSSAELQADGLHVGYSCDARHEGDTLRAMSAYNETRGAWLLSEPVAADVTGTSLTVPYTSLKHVPAAGDVLSVRLRMEADAATTDQATEVACTWAETSEIDSGTSETTGRLAVRRTVPAHDYDAVYMECDGGLEAAELVSSSESERTFEVLPPVGAAWKLVVVSGTSSSWCLTEEEGAELPPAFVWTWENSAGDRRAAAVYARRGGKPSMADSSSADATAYETVGRERPVYRAGKASTRDLSVDGTILGHAPAAYADVQAWSTRAAFRELMSQRRALFRGPDGGRYEVYVSGVDMPLESGLWADVSVTQHEEAR